jgi:hypothetical protein
LFTPDKIKDLSYTRFGVNRQFNNRYGLISKNWLHTHKKSRPNISREGLARLRAAGLADGTTAL